MTTRTRLAYTKETALNAICPYFTMFPLEYPLRILRRTKRTGLNVLDPFCGRGTTLYAERQLGMKAWGIDSSQIAVAIAKAKLAKCDVEGPLKLAGDILSAEEPRDVPTSPFFRLAYHEDTLRDICIFRESLNSLKADTDESAVLTGATVEEAIVMACYLEEAARTELAVMAIGDSATSVEIPVEEAKARAATSGRIFERM